jgi:hypothetical protein
MACESWVAFKGTPRSRMRAAGKALENSSIRVMSQPREAACSWDAHALMLYTGQYHLGAHNLGTACCVVDPGSQPVITHVLVQRWGSRLLHHHRTWRRHVPRPPLLARLHSGGLWAVGVHYDVHGTSHHRPWAATCLHQLGPSNLQ